MTIEQYLASDQAVADLAAALAQPRAKHERPCWDLPAVRDGKSSWFICTADAWTAVALIGHGRYEEESEQADYPVRGGLSIAVYFQPDGDHKRVSDLGEAVRALRLRAGLLHVDGDCVSWLLSEQTEYAGLSWAGDAIFASTVPIADLPRTICAVMLAAYRVSRLEVPQ